MLSESNKTAADACIEYVVMVQQRLDFVKNYILRNRVNHDHISHITLMRYLHKLMQNVEVEIKAALLDKIPLVLDGWSCR